MSRLQDLSMNRTSQAMITYRYAIGVFLAYALGLSLALLKRVLVLEFGAHDEQ